MEKTVLTKLIIPALLFSLITFDLYAYSGIIEKCTPEVNWMLRSIYLIKGSKISGNKALEQIEKIKREEEVGKFSSEYYRHYRQGVDSIGIRHYTFYVSGIVSSDYFYHLGDKLYAKEYYYCSFSNRSPDDANCARLCFFEWAPKEDR